MARRFATWTDEALLADYRATVTAARVAGVIGASEAHKTTLINRVIAARRELRRRGLVKTYHVRDDTD